MFTSFFSGCCDARMVLPGKFLLWYKLVFAKKLLGQKPATLERCSSIILFTIRLTVDVVKVL